MHLDAAQGPADPVKWIARVGRAPLRSPSTLSAVTGKASQGKPLPSGIHIPDPGFDPLLSNPLIARRFVRQLCHVADVEVGRHLVVRKRRLLEGGIADGLNFGAEADGFVHAVKYDCASNRKNHCRVSTRFNASALNPNSSSAPSPVIQSSDCSLSCAVASRPMLTVITVISSVTTA